VAVVGGVTINGINNPFGGGLIVFTAPFAILFTALWIVGMINSINFIDGLDAVVSVATSRLTTGGFMTSADQPESPCQRHRRCSRFLPRTSTRRGSSSVRQAYLVGLRSPSCDPRHGQGGGRPARPRRADHRHVLDHRPASVAASLAVQSGSDAHPPSAARLGCRTATVLVICTAQRSPGQPCPYQVGQLTAFVGVLVLFGAFLFVVTRRETDALEASTYDDEEADAAEPG
jgi:hypothetical protein